MIAIKHYKNGGFGTNNYLLIDENSKEACLIDCSDDMQEITQDIKNMGLNLKYILLTHGHFDHIGRCAQFSNEFPDAKIGLHKEDMILIENIATQCQLFVINNIKKPEIDLLINEDTALTLGDKPIKVIHTPGHSRGSCSFLIEDKLFSGDTLFFEEIGRCDLFGGSFEEIGFSIKNKLFSLPDETLVYPGHGQSSTIGHEKEHNAYFGRLAKST